MRNQLTSHPCSISWRLMLVFHFFPDFPGRQQWILYVCSLSPSVFSSNTTVLPKEIHRLFCLPMYTRLLTCPKLLILWRCMFILAGQHSTFTLCVNLLGKQWDDSVSERNIMLYLSELFVEIVWRSGVLKWKSSYDIRRITKGRIRGDSNNSELIKKSCSIMNIKFGRGWTQIKGWIFTKRYQKFFTKSFLVKIKISRMGGPNFKVVNCMRCT